MVAAFAQGKLERNLGKTQHKSEKTRKADYVNKKPENWVRKRAFKSRFSQASTSSGFSIGGFEIKIRKINLSKLKAPTNDRERHLLVWTEPSTGDQEEKTWTVGPLVLPNGIINASADKKFLFYTNEGIDIRDSAGVSLGERKPLSSGKVKTCSLPISSLVLYSNVDEEDDRKFLEHWEELTGLELDEILLNDVADGVSCSDQFEAYIPKSWYADNSESRNALPVLAMQSLHKGTQDKYVGLIKTPAQAGDFLWLFSKFLHHCFEQQGQSQQESPRYRHVQPC